eukprot:jgi/Ulvmu1/10921/UM007_0100.1
MTMSCCTGVRPTHQAAFSSARSAPRRADRLISRAAPKLNYILTLVSGDGAVSATDLQDALASSAQVMSRVLDATAEFGASSIGKLAVFGDLWLTNVLFSLTIAVSVLSLIKMAPKS